MTQTELSLLQQQIHTEELLRKKAENYGKNCTDPQLKQKCLQIAAQHQDHIIRLINQLR